MFQSAELGHKVAKARYLREEPKLREALLDAQYDLLRDAKFPVVVVIGGVDGAGKGETVHTLNEWMDPRHLRTHAFGAPSDEERERPRMWRYWRALPPKGRIGILFGAWHTDPIVARVRKECDADELDRRIAEIVRFERMLTDEGALLLKFWFHLSKDAQRHRLKDLQKDPRTRWRVTEADWERFDLYDRFRKVSEHYLRTTSVGEAPWIVVEGTDERYRNLMVGRTLLEALRDRLDGRTVRAPGVAAASVIPAIDRKRVLSSMDLTVRLSEKKYESRLEDLQGRLSVLSRDPDFPRLSVVAVFEGADAAGKGSAIRRVTSALDARIYSVVPVAAPTDEERAQPYLWRFWRHLPRRGRFTIFDRSWYGRVLVERVEGFCSEAEWLRAYAEIDDFEAQLAREGTVLVKYWLQISAEEQLARFREREKTGHKRYKITPDDWRNREKRDAYEIAADDMIERTSTQDAPWTLVAANDKRWARIQVLETLVERIEKALKHARKRGETG